MNNETYYTDPRKEKSKWIIEKKFRKDVIRKFEFDNKQLAIDFIKTVNFYLDDKYTGESKLLGTGMLN
jgi:hypothetical protein